MKKSLLFLSLLCLFINKSFSQENKFPNGVYLSLEQFKNRTPAYNIDLDVKTRSVEGIAFGGGNDYKLISRTDSITSRFIRKKIFAYVKHDSIFINCQPMKLQTGYALCITSGKVISFYGSMTNGDAMAVSYVGGSIASIATANNRYLYVLSLKTGYAIKVSKSYLTKQLSDRPDLLKQYNEEKKPESQEVLLKYIMLLNN